MLRKSDLNFLRRLLRQVDGEDKAELALLVGRAEHQHHKASARLLAAKPRRASSPPQNRKETNT